MNIFPKNLNPFGSFEAESKQIKKLKKEAKKLASYPLFDLKNNAIYSLPEILILCILAAICRSSLEAKNKDDKRKRRRQPSADNIFIHLKDKLTIDKIETMFGHFLNMSAVRTLLRRFPSLKLTIAIDFTPESFYGDKESKGVVGYELKNGTHYCFKFMTVCLVLNGVRYFLFAYPFYKGDDKVYLMNRAIEFLKSLSLHPRRILVDREFQDVDSLALCGEDGREFIVPAKDSGNYRRARKQLERLPGLVRGYALTNACDESLQANLVIMEEPTGRVTKDGKKIEFSYITNIHENHFKDDVYLIYKLYSSRWGIETAHRVHDMFRVRTCCKDPIVRYFFFMLAVLLYNLWIHVNLIQNNFVIGKDFKIKITVPDFCEELLDFFREHRRIIPVGLAM